MTQFLFPALSALVVTAACAAPSQDCTPRAATSIGGEARIGAGSDGFVSGTEITLSTRVTNRDCVSVGGRIGG